MLIDKAIKKYLDYKFSNNQIQLKGKSDVHYFKLPCISNLSHHIKIRLSKLCKEFSKGNFNIKLVFNSFKVKNCFSYNDPIPNNLKSFLVYKFTFEKINHSFLNNLKSEETESQILHPNCILQNLRNCASCSFSYIGETYCHFKTRIEEHIKKDKKSHGFKYLYSTARCLDP